MRISGFAGLLLLAGLFAAPAAPAYADQMKVWCPANARGTVAHDGDAAFYATPQSSRIQGVSIETIGGNVALACHYRMFGGDYIIWREPPAGYPNCVVVAGENTKFYCAT